MTEQSSDEQIVSLILKGEKESYREIIRRYEDKLSRYLHKFISDTDDVEDILQVVFIKAYKNLYGFDISKKFSSWIYRIAHNEAVNHLKRRRNKGRVALDDVEYKLIDEKSDIGTEADRKFLKKDMEGVIGKLDLKYREPIVLFYLEEMSYEEISDVLRIPKNTVGTLILRGKKMIKDNLEEINKNYGR
ncbi:MAG: RNA polymerase sigma factor [Candidatus Pacebacteria bacterium]|nr:RNA polymerase sigma factor [Candidatus Paceibacterota bacterium]